jgi:hypothetical protein
MESGSPDHVVHVTRRGNTFELSIPELLLVVRDRDIAAAWIKLQRRAELVRSWASELDLVLPPTRTPGVSSKFFWRF